MAETPVDRERSHPERAHDEYAEAAIQRLLAEDGEIAEQGIDIIRRDGVIVLAGEVESEERRQAIARGVAARFPDKQVRNDISIVRVGKPGEVEELR